MVATFVAIQTENYCKYNINRELKPLPFLVIQSKFLCFLFFFSLSYVLFCTSSLCVSPT